VNRASRPASASGREVEKMVESCHGKQMIKKKKERSANKLLAVFTRLAVTWLRKKMRQAYCTNPLLCTVIYYFNLLCILS
jgi:hypothetical protein